MADERITQWSALIDRMQPWCRERGERLIKHAPQALARLESAPTLPDIPGEAAFRAAFHAATLPPEVFIGSVDWSSVQEEHKALSRALSSLRHRLGRLSQEDLIRLGTKEEHAARRKGAPGNRVYQADVLVRRLDLHLAELMRVCDLPPPAPSDLEPRKRTAARVNGALKARLLKREFRKLYTRPMHGLVADLVSVAEQLDDPLTEDDVKRA